MLAREVIKKNRENLEKLNRYHQKWLSSDNKEGLQCLDYDGFLKLYNMTDREIIEKVLAKGVQIEDAEEFLAGLNR